MKIIDLSKLIFIFEKYQKEINENKKSTVKECLLINDILSYLRNDAIKDCEIKSNSEWVVYKSEVGDRQPYHCRECGWSAPSAGYHAKYYNFCPDCGAKMKQDFITNYI